jgi:hypothetical protein
MKLLTCTKCGGSDFLEQNGFRICRYCRSKYAILSDESAPSDSNIALDDDVKMLLQKCRNDPANAHKYASLVLDIDPFNAEAKKILGGKK